MTTPPPKRSPSPGFSANLDDNHEDKRLKIDENVEEAHIPPPVGPFSSLQPQDSAPSEPEEHIPPLPASPPAPDEELPVRDGCSTSPSGDIRIPLWQNETRAFNGEIIVSPTSKNRNKKAAARKVARQAQSAPLVVDGKPQFNLFVDGSHQSGGITIAHQTSGPRPQARFARGGYGVVFRNPYHGQGQGQGRGRC
ncbi:hypothetical protein SMACR_08037 [Sordaria macrospora]|uniref:Uncharacterized protein n=1 Tax=Sordaria macrospora TaxID=5147 RepID=A0A8S8ZSP9_SORMA|nr:hypothetical protein SMACR_08037 [Sordaria macrospora]WPJ57249.1 hypothetical protein SMAC4_08037 [Sordaria macrospora]